jgi:hypothetical protein
MAGPSLTVAVRVAMEIWTGTKKRLASTEQRNSIKEDLHGRPWELMRIKAALITISGTNTSNRSSSILEAVASEFCLGQKDPGPDCHTMMRRPVHGRAFCIQFPILEESFSAHG